MKNQLLKLYSKKENKKIQKEAKDLHYGQAKQNKFIAKNKHTIIVCVCVCVWGGGGGGEGDRVSARRGKLFPLTKRKYKTI